MQFVMVKYKKYGKYKSLIEEKIEIKHYLE
jgi:hypothetical protein